MQKKKSESLCRDDVKPKLENYCCVYLAQWWLVPFMGKAAVGLEEFKQCTIVIQEFPMYECGVLWQLMKGCFSLDCKYVVFDNVRKQLIIVFVSDKD